MQYFNAILTAIHDLLLGWLPVAPAFWGLLIVSAVMGVLLLVAFRYTTNLAAFRRVRDTITAELLAARLFKDDLRVTLRAEGQLFVQAARLLVCMIRPFVVVLVPMVLFLVQLSLWYEYRPILPGERVIVSAELADASALGSVADPPETSPDLRVETRALRLRNSARVEWALAADNQGLHELRIQAGDQQVTVPIRVTDRVKRVTWRLPGTGFWDQLLHPGSRPLSGDGPVIGVDVRYPLRSTPLVGLDIHWMITFFILSMIFALIAKPILRIKF